MAKKARRRRPEARIGYQAGYAWAESGRSLNDLEVVTDFWALEVPEDATHEILNQQDALYDKMRDEVFEDGELAELQERSNDYQEGWWNGVVTFYVGEITPKGQ